MATQQFQAILRGKPDELPDICQQYETDLHRFLQKYPDDPILITWDFNLPSSSQLIRTLKYKLGLADTISENAEEQYKNMPTYK